MRFKELNRRLNELEQPLLKPGDALFLLSCVAISLYEGRWGLVLTAFLIGFVVNLAWSRRNDP